MAVGKNKRLGKKKGKKKTVDPFTKKDWYTVKAPIMFTKRDAGKTLVTRTQGTKVASEELNGRIFEVSLADLNNNEADAYRKIRLCVTDRTCVQGDSILTTFHGMDFTRDKLCSLIKKWQSLIEARVDVKTTDGYTLRMFCIGFTQKRKNQVKNTCYAQAGQIRNIRKKMMEIMRAQASKCDLKDLVKEFIPESIGKEIEKACGGIFPLRDVCIRKVKILKSPKFDLVKLMELHDESKAEDVGAKQDRINPAVETTALEGSGGRL